MNPAIATPNKSRYQKVSWSSAKRQRRFYVLPWFLRDNEFEKKKTIKSVSAGKFANIEQQRQVTEHGN